MIVASFIRQVERINCGRRAFPRLIESDFIMAAQKFAIDHMDNETALACATRTMREWMTGYSSMPFPMVYVESMMDSDKYPGDRFIFTAEEFEWDGAPATAIAGAGFLNGAAYVSPYEIVVLPHADDFSVAIYRDGESLLDKAAAGATETIDALMDDPMFDGAFRGFCMALGVIYLKSARRTLMPEPAPRINRKRERRGELPLFGYTVVELPRQTMPVATARGPLEFLRRSPRIHPRRAFPRTLRDGRRTWVRATVVGDRKKGIVFHDYHVDPKPNEKGPAVAGGPAPSPQ